MSVPGPASVGGPLTGNITGDTWVAVQPPDAADAVVLLIDHQVDVAKPLWNTAAPSTAIHRQKLVHLPDGSHNARIAGSNDPNLEGPQVLYGLLFERECRLRGHDASCSLLPLKRFCRRRATTYISLWHKRREHASAPHGNGAEASEEKRSSHLVAYSEVLWYFCLILLWRLLWRLLWHLLRDIHRISFRTGHS